MGKGVGQSDLAAKLGDLKRGARARLQGVAISA